MENWPLYPIPINIFVQPVRWLILKCNKDCLDSESSTDNKKSFADVKAEVLKKLKSESGFPSEEDNDIVTRREFRQLEAYVKEQLTQLSAKDTPNVPEDDEVTVTHL
eukprot:m.141361 g.141361  ORF g.141361 m.141361 type:complete len:107 (+) comp38340_c0_seq10:1142-1462(+)